MFTIDGNTVTNTPEPPSAEKVIEDILEFGSYVEPKITKISDANTDLIVYLEASLAAYTLQGGTDDTLSSMLSGYTPNVRHRPLISRSYHQQAFFSKPMCRLTYHNLIRDRVLARLLTRKDGAARYVRVGLDARSGYLHPNSYMSEVDGDAYELRITSDKLAAEAAFIPLLANSIVKSSGAPDDVASNYVSKEGLRKEQIGWIEGDGQTYKAWDLDVSFSNYQQETIHLMLDTWKRYSTMLKRGEAYPYLDLMIGKKIDYVTGIWIFDLAEDNETITHSMQTRGYPYVLSKGRLFDIEEDNTALRKRTNTVDTRFKCFGVDYDDQISFLDFNRITAQQNPDLRFTLMNDDNRYVFVPTSLSQLFKEVAIPWVDLEEAKLRWLVKREDIISVTDIISDSIREV